VRFGPLEHPIAGVSVPLASLRSLQGCGTGEYPDLAALGQWCAACGLQLIQLLPINDTGSNASPYSALSAFALHPLYIRLSDVPGADSYAYEIEVFRTAAEARPRLAYGGTLAFKLSILERIFADSRLAIRSDRGLAAWRRENPWVEAYAAFRALEREHGGAAWSTWRRPAAEDGAAAGARAGVADAWRRLPESCLFYAWVQRVAERQLRAAVPALERAGVRLKGDLPILMSEQSADVWHDRRCFDLGRHAGAPPDMFSPRGQNWGFPTYDWGAMAEDAYRWWKARLGQSAKFFHAIRVDHVLGFFRIWSIPKGERGGELGSFDPYEAIGAEELASAGFDRARIRWLSVPHVRGPDLAAAVGADAPRVASRYLERVGSEDLFTIKPAVDSEAAILALVEREPVKRFLLELHADRALLARDDGSFYPSWYHAKTRAYASLTGAERERLSGIFDHHRARSERAWESRGRQILTMARDASDMLVCAEDLGDVPDCVPRVLADLGILGLRIERWTRRWKEPGSPFIPPADYPWLTVATPSVHDTSTLRGWWEGERAEREEYWPTLGLPGPCPERLPPEVHEAILRRILGAGSAICTLQLQELLDLDPELRSADPKADRINVPGTVADTNWSWRMPIAIERLAERADLSRRICSLSSVRSPAASREPR
jgi:4-alpha-glucanotransferase